MYVFISEKNHMGKVSVSDPYSLNPDPAKNLNPDPDLDLEDPWIRIRIQAIS